MRDDYKLAITRVCQGPGAERARELLSSIIVRERLSFFEALAVAYTWGVRDLAELCASNRLEEELRKTPPPLFHLEACP